MATQKTLESIFNNYVNGNLQDAKKQAKRVKLEDLSSYFQTACCFNTKLECNLTAMYLKTRISFDELNHLKLYAV